MEKIYYSISEVAKLLNLNQSKLRFWEKEFKQLKPKQNDKGTRFYTKDDITTIKKIQFLTEDQRLTLQGAKEKMNQKMDVVDKQHQVVERLKSIRSELQNIINAL
jgi:DNA-binding transcriptional MerR regulator